MNPNIMNNKTWWNFFYFPDMYYGSMEQGNGDEKLIAAEWKKKLKLNSSVESIYTYLFDSKNDTTGTSASVIKELRSNKWWEDFFTFAKKCENAVYWTDFWEERDVNADVKKQLALITEGKLQLEKQNDPFWKKKYGFQVLRLAFYLNDEPTFNKIYENYFGIGKEKTPIDWWATHYKSMWLERNGEIDSANYLHAQVLCNSTNKRHESLRWYRSHDLDKQVALCKTDIEKGNVYVAAALREYEFATDEINKAYQYDPNNSLLPLVLIREMNKLEDQFGESKIQLDYEWFYLYYGDKKGNEFAYHLVNLFNSVKKMDRLEKGNPDFYHLLLAELAIMNRDINLAKQNLIKVEEKDPSIQFEKRVLDAMLLCISEDLTKDNVQNKLSVIVRTLMATRTGKFESERILQSLFKFISEAFMNEDMKAKGHLTYDFCESYLDSWGDIYEYNSIDKFSKTAEKDILEVLDLFNKKDKNEWEKFLLSPYPNAYQFWDDLGTLRLRNNRIEEALKAYQQIPVEGWMLNFDSDVLMDENPFVMSHLKKYEEDYVYWTKTEVTDTLLKLTVKENKNLGDYKLLGNLWYNLSNWGNSWYMLSKQYDNTSPYCKSDNKDEGYNADANDVDRMVLTNSMKYYKEALKLSKDVEEQTEIIYMLAWCCFMIGDHDQYPTWAGKYEQMKKTAFYKGEKCTITPLYDEPEILHRALNGWSDLYFD